MNHFQAFRIFNDDGRVSGRVVEARFDELTPGDVVIKAAYSSVNYKDALAATSPRIIRTFPRIGGIDVAGTVESSRDPRFRPGDAVIATSYEIGVGNDGGYAEYVRVPADWIVPLPSGLTLRESMALGTAGFTAALAVMRLEHNGLTPGRGPVAVTGATGGVGGIAIAVLNGLGYKVTAITGKEHEGDYLRQLGASDVVSRQTIQFTERPIEHGQWAAAVDAAGGDLLSWLVKSTTAWAGVASTGLTGGIDLKLTVIPFILRGVSLIGIDSVTCPMDIRKTVWQRLATDMKRDLSPMIREITLDELPQAFATLAAGQARGRFVVRLARSIRLKADTTSEMDTTSDMLETSIVGSLPKPSWLADSGVLRAPWRLSGDELRVAQDEAVRLAIREQEEAGLDVVTDGELRRRHYIGGVLDGLTGIDSERTGKKRTRGGRYTESMDVPRIVGDVARRAPILVDACRAARALTTRRLKVTLPGPMTMADDVADEFYGDDHRALAMRFADILNAEARDLVDAGADVIQFDEPCFNVFVDEVEQWGIAALERCMDGVKATRAVHICYGYGTPLVLAWKSANTNWGHYGVTLPLLARTSVDQISVECAASGVDPAVLREAGEKDLLVGVIDVGSEEVETPEIVAARIRRVLDYVPADRLKPCTDCGLVPRTPGAAFGKMRALAAGATIVREELYISAQRRSRL